MPFIFCFLLFQLPLLGAIPKIIREKEKKKEVSFGAFVGAHGVFLMIPIFVVWKALIPELHSNPWFFWSGVYTMELISVFPIVYIWKLYKIEAGSFWKKIWEEFSDSFAYPIAIFLLLFFGGIVLAVAFRDSEFCFLTIVGIVGICITLPIREYRDRKRTVAKTP